MRAPSDGELLDVLKNSPWERAYEEALVSNEIDEAFASLYDDREWYDIDVSDFCLPSSIEEAVLMYLDQS
jgi:hypothetical protein